ncbi:hypothetical protein [uncultured Litoreibacter sp.]|uniref:hypothetical protein n=1 Tax=uncultured Litoreibacter sp. TaxID=1392394 RepID=UPI00261BD2B9|nr:hypothetical protein [uncultured Litoreibacter sp.]
MMEAENSSAKPWPTWKKVALNLLAGLCFGISISIFIGRYGWLWLPALLLILAVGAIFQSKVEKVIPSLRTPDNDVIQYHWAFWVPLVAVLAFFFFIRGEFPNPALPRILPWT